MSQPISPDSQTNDLQLHCTYVHAACEDTRYYSPAQTLILTPAHCPATTQHFSAWSINRNGQNKHFEEFSEAAQKELLNSDLCTTAGLNRFYAHLKG